MGEGIHAFLREKGLLENDFVLGNAFVTCMLGVVCWIKHEKC